jgi:hypothetical protein
MVWWLLENTLDNTACSQWKWYYLSIAPQTASRNHQWLNTSFVPSRFSSLSCHWPAWHLCTHNDIKGSPPSKFTFQVAQRTLRAPTGRPKRTRWAVRLGPFGWSSGHADSGPRPRVRLGRTLRPTRGRIA